MGEKRTVTIDGETFEVDLEPDGNSWKATVEGETFTIEVGGAPPKGEKKRRSTKKRKKSGVVSSTIPGKIITVEVEVGQDVSEGDVVLILEAMKMQNEVVAPVSGTVKEVNCEAGSTIEANLPLVVIEPEIESED
ncbi:MAG TPA: biotin/lipoyl-binding protein [Candidatus Thalassarchaeaceae archaeon]|nr:biotin/lipoyl-containing protein [Candidatus Thalassarchaeaceae archaeon]DAC51389.1 MAG TPA: biotin/lipoyl-binding protein [Candidatus Poseidoniales archaeon]HIH82675.1 biotin/lipoyl-binding protein [Candidatus Thalassarchaeaceae archaeon]